MANDNVDQDALAAEWGLTLDPGGKAASGANAKPKSDADLSDDELAAQGAEAAAEAGDGDDDVASQWAAMVDESQSQYTKGADRILNQEEIDGLLGFNLADLAFNDNSGIRAIIDSAMVSY